MAMALAPLCTVLPGRQLEVDNPNVVSKSYPAYWDHLTSAGFHIEPHN
jgi:3-phosphoshikimate 1-carboxyvinyltransferase